jgi:hypothetical protein
MKQNLDGHSFNTLSQAVAYYQRIGYNYAFKLDPVAEKPEDWCIEGFYRFEGASNPSDSSIIYLLHRKGGADKGMLVNAYGIYSSSIINDFIDKVKKCGETEG